MTCARESLLTKVTRVPRGTVNDFGETPLDVMVIVVSLLDPPPGDGDVGELDPHAAVRTATPIAAIQRPAAVHLNRTSSRY